MRTEESPGAGLSSVADRVGDGRQACGEVGILHVDVVGDVELYGREVPYAAYACGDEHVRARLCMIFGYGKHRKAKVHPADEICHLRDVSDRHAVKLAAYLCGIRVERNNEIQVVLAEAVITEKGCAEGSGSDENGVGGVIPAEAYGDRMRERRRRKSLSGCADHAGDGEFLARDHRIESARGGEFGGGDEFHSTGHLLAYPIKVKREVPDNPQRESYCLTVIFHAADYIILQPCLSTRKPTNSTLFGDGIAFFSKCSCRV